MVTSLESVEKFVLAFRDRVGYFVGDHNSTAAQEFVDEILKYGELDASEE